MKRLSLVQFWPSARNMDGGRTASNACTRICDCAEVQRELLDRVEEASPTQLADGLEQTWTAWDISLRCNTIRGSNSFGLIALGVIFDCLEKWVHSRE